MKMLRGIVFYFTTWVVSQQAENSSRTDVANFEQTQQYSFPPNNTPITKVYIFGRPVFIRPPFVIPQRDNYQPINRNHWRTGQEDTRTFSKNAVENSNVLANEGLLRDALQKEFLGDADSTRYLLPERPFPPPDEMEPHLAYARQIPKYPLPQCYTNDSGFMCCNSKLEQVMKQVFDELASDDKWNRCNAQKLANNLQNRTESVFNTKFEVLVGLGDFASKSHFRGDLICKIEIQDRFILSYATPNIHQRTDYRALPPSLKATSTI